MNRKTIGKQIETYQRNHKGSDFGDVERSKVERDKMSAAKAQKSVERALPTDLCCITDEDMVAYENASYEQKKVRGNAKTHQNRYQSLSQHDEFQ